MAPPSLARLDELVGQIQAFAPRPLVAAQAFVGRGRRHWLLLAGELTARNKPEVILDGASLGDFLGRAEALLEVLRMEQSPLMAPTSAEPYVRPQDRMLMGRPMGNVRGH
jgi:hypothetical protein